MTEHGALDDPQYRWIQRAALLVVPLIQLGANPAAFINPGANVSIDAWVNTGFFLNLPGHLERFGFIFIVCATGKSAAEMLALLRARLPNDPATESSIAAAEQAKITKLRLEKLSA